MVAVNKYIKAPLVSRDGAKYADQELRKIELTTSGLVEAFEELFNMALEIETGTFVLTLTGCTTSPTVTARYAKAGRLVLLFIPAVTATSNSTSCTLTGLPVSLHPDVDQGKQWCNVRDNGSPENGSAKVLASGVIELRDGSFTATTWTNSGTKGIDDTNLIYML